MSQHEPTSKTLVASRREVVAPPLAAESPVRVVPVWATPPDAQVLVMLNEASSEATAALRVIRHRLELRRGEGMWTFAVTSPRAGEGKSTFATQLALVLSEAQRARVLLVEANLQRPSLARILGFNVPEGQGLSAQIVRKMRGGNEPWFVTRSQWSKGVDLRGAVKQLGDRKTVGVVLWDVQASGKRR
jgi:Mrp family chromosome partitioning ATPase